MPQWLRCYAKVRARNSRVHEVQGGCNGRTSRLNGLLEKKLLSRERLDHVLRCTGERGVHWLACSKPWSDLDRRSVSI